MVSALTAGVIFGISAGFAPGPLLTLVIVQTLKHNVKEGIKVAAAPVLTDIPIILATLILLNRLSQLNKMLGIIGLLGGGYILYLAYESFRAGPIHLKNTDEKPRSLKKGILINWLNPHPYIFWFTVGVPLILKAQADHPAAPWLFILGFFFCIIGTKIFVALIVSRSRAFLTSRRYIVIMRLLGCLLALFAVILIKDALTLFIT